MGRRHVLTNAKRKMIISLVANGSSRRAAAQYVGCAPTIVIEPDDGDDQLPDDFARVAHASRNSGKSSQSGQTPPKLQQATQG